MMADGLELSGIVAILFAGIGMKYYTVPNLSVQATQVTTSFFQMLSKLSETFVVANVYPCAMLINYYREPPKQISKKQQHAIFFSGLRGAMAFALALQSVTDLPNNHGRVLLTATLFTIIFTVLFIGGSTPMMLMRLKID
ncbi:hypothetical protein CY35_11G110700, partial [Sphagnum magellanicum]